MTYKFKIQIIGITKPPVWRKVEVPAHFTFLQLHEVIQLAFDWSDSHLFEFKDKEYRNSISITIPDEEEEEFNFDFGPKTYDASQVKLSEIFTNGANKLLYIYDFGDNWVHGINVESVSDSKQEVASCLAAKGCCPPEDCGGVYAYEKMKAIFKTTPNGEEANLLREWLSLDRDQVWDVNFCDIDAINSELKDI